MNSTLVRIGYPSAEDEWDYSEFDPEQRIVLTDFRPRIRLGVLGHFRPGKGWGEHGARNTGKKNTYQRIEPPTGQPSCDWFECALPIHEIANERCYGTRSLRINLPVAELNLYLLPARFFDEAAWLRMLDDIRSEMGYLPWVAETQHRVFVDLEPDRRFDVPHLLVEDVRQEVAYARSLLREPGFLAREQDTDYSPESLLLPLWARRRLNDLSRLLEAEQASAERLVEEVQRRAALGADNSRVEAVSAERNRHQARSVELRAGILAVRGLMREVEQLPLVGPVLTPMMQFDHRLRRLLRAFRFRPEEKLAHGSTPKPFSGLQPLAAPKVFELWSVVWCIHVLRSNGWQVDRPHIEGPVDFFVADSRARWTATKADLTAWIDWNAQPKSVEVDTCLPVDQRNPRLSAFEASLHEAIGFAQPDGCWVSWRNPLTPDILIRVQTGSSATFSAIGVLDPTLADPERGEKSKKPEKVASYLQKLAWLTPSGTLIRCLPLGGAAVVPGPRSQWADHEESAAVVDCRLVCPIPGVLEPHTGEAEVALMKLFDYLADGARLHAAPAVDRAP